MDGTKIQVLNTTESNVTTTVLTLDSRGSFYLYDHHTKSFKLLPMVHFVSANDEYGFREYVKNDSVVCKLSGHGCMSELRILYLELSCVFKYTLNNNIAPY